MLRIDHLQILTLPPLTFEVEGGACLAIEGPSGSGKSRLLRAIADLDPADGFVFLDGEERHTVSPTGWRRRVRYVAAEPRWWAPTAMEHFASSEAARRICALFDIGPDMLAQDIERLSTGERQRIALARALEDDPEVLLLDEPTSALDDAQTERVEAEILRRLADDTVVLIASHDGAQLDRLTDARLQLGRMPEAKSAERERAP